MSTLSPEQDARAREFEGPDAEPTSVHRQKIVADAIGVSESTVSGWKEGGVERWCRALVLLGLRVIPSDVQCPPSQYIQALTLAEFGLQAEKRRPGPLGREISIKSRLAGRFLYRCSEK